MLNSENAKWSVRFGEKIPWGSSTCSKAPLYMPEEPAAIERGKGCRIWDVDGREFIDFRNGLGPITLGYQFPEVDEAIKKQMEKGIVFGHPHHLECEVAELICNIIPCAEQARFLKTGGEAIAACMRIARAYTGKEHIIQIGYNGWLNSLAPGGRQLPGQKSGAAVPGVPSCLSALHHACRWDSMEDIENVYSDCDNNVAAVVIAADYEKIDRAGSFYPAVREFTRKHGSLLIFDEIVTGFRIAIGGAQEYFKVTPDLAVFSKGMANGMPLSVYAGKKEVMATCDKGGKVVVSSTFAGETLSLAAAKAAINTYITRDVIGHLWKQGGRMWGKTNELLDKYHIPLKFLGFWPCPALTSVNNSSADVRDGFIRAAYKNGVSLYNVSYVNFSHSDGDIDEALQRLEMACRQLSEDGE